MAVERASATGHDANGSFSCDQEVVVLLDVEKVVRRQGKRVEVLEEWSGLRTNHGVADFAAKARDVSIDLRFPRSAATSKSVADVKEGALPFPHDEQIEEIDAVIRQDRIEIIKVRIQAAIFRGSDDADIAFFRPRIQSRIL